MRPQPGFRFWLRSIAMKIEDDAGRLSRQSHCGGNSRQMESNHHQGSQGSRPRLCRIAPHRSRAHQESAHRPPARTGGRPDHILHSIAGKKRPHGIFTHRVRPNPNSCASSHAGVGADAQRTGTRPAQERRGRYCPLRNTSVSSPAARLRVSRGPNLRIVYSAAVG
jgi:hypothetical protein